MSLDFPQRGASHSTTDGVTHQASQPPVVRRPSWIEGMLLQNVEQESMAAETRNNALTLLSKSADLEDERPTNEIKRFIRSSRMNSLQYSGGDQDSSGHAGIGHLYSLEDSCNNGRPPSISEESHEDSHKIGELPSTAICGNDITASCFYVVGELAKNAGVYSPICTLLSSFTLFCFRSVYGEVVMALPLNGGIYNLLLNSSTKRTASVAACLTILSYTATGVVSSVSAADYLSCSPLFGEVHTVPVAIGILGFFAVLMLMGMQESSVVASALFMFHLSVLLMLATFCLLFLQDAGLGQFWANMQWSQQPPLLDSIFFGFSSAMLGVSGFETSANFVEEQKPGVFPKTLTNMWISVSLINVSLPALAICVLPLDDLVGDKSPFALAVLAHRVAGPLLRDLVAIDALLVLSGAVLTSYVGVCGLFQRMAGDRCLPEFFSITNSWRGTPHYTILIFFLVCASMCVLLDGDITLLGAIYSISFLLVMGLFAFCGLWMKLTRPTLPRTINTHPMMFVMGLLLVATAFTAVVFLHPEMLTYFYMYYGVTTFMVMTTFARVAIFSAFLRLVSSNQTVRNTLKLFIKMDVAQKWIMSKLELLRSQGVVYFTKNASLSQINRALQYIEENEEARWVRVIHVYQDDENVPQHLIEYVQLLDCVYPRIRVDCILAKGEFGPSMVQHISQRIAVPVNCMFINCPKHNFKHSLDRMGGVRVILNSEKSSLLDGIKTMAAPKDRLDSMDIGSLDVSTMHRARPMRSVRRGFVASDDEGLEEGLSRPMIKRIESAPA